MITQIADEHDNIIKDNNIDIANIFANLYSTIIKTINVKIMDFLNLCDIILNIISDDNIEDVVFTYDIIKTFVLFMSLNNSYSLVTENVINKFFNLTGISCDVVDFFRLSAYEIDMFDKFVFDSQFDTEHLNKVSNDLATYITHGEEFISNGTPPDGNINVLLNRRITVEDVYAKYLSYLAIKHLHGTKSQYKL